MLSNRCVCNLWYSPKRRNLAQPADRSESDFENLLSEPTCWIQFSSVPKFIEFLKCLRAPSYQLMWVGHADLVWQASSSSVDQIPFSAASLKLCVSSSFLHLHLFWPPSLLSSMPALFWGLPAFCRPCFPAFQVSSFVLFDSSGPHWNNLGRLKIFPVDSVVSVCGAVVHCSSPWGGGTHLTLPRGPRTEVSWLSSSGDRPRYKFSEDEVV